MLGYYARPSFCNASKSLYPILMSHCLSFCLSVPLVRAMLFRTVTSDRISIALSSRTRIDVQSLRACYYSLMGDASSSQNPGSTIVLPTSIFLVSHCTAPHYRALFTGSPCLSLPTTIFIRAFNYCFLPIHSPVSVIRHVFRRVGGFTAGIFNHLALSFPLTLPDSTA